MRTVPQGTVAPSRQGGPRAHVVSQAERPASIFGAVNAKLGMDSDKRHEHRPQLRGSGDHRTLNPAINLRNLIMLRRYAPVKQRVVSQSPSA